MEISGNLDLFFFSAAQTKAKGLRMIHFTQWKFENSDVILYLLVSYCCFDCLLDCRGYELLSFSSFLPVSYGSPVLMSEQKIQLCWY